MTLTPNYKLQTRRKKNQPWQYEVLETQTHLVVRKYSKKALASNMCQHLNLGGGFDGFTPAFIVSDAPSMTPIDVNEAFTEIINNL